MSRSVLALAITFLPVASSCACLAAELPEFGTRLHCESADVIQEERTKPMRLENCAKLEVQNRAKVAKVWDTLPDNIQERCLLQQSPYKAGSYSRLSFCVQFQVAAYWMNNGGELPKR